MCVENRLWWTKVEQGDHRGGEHHGGSDLDGYQITFHKGCTNVSSYQQRRLPIATTHPLPPIITPEALPYLAGKKHPGII